MFKVIAPLLAVPLAPENPKSPPAIPEDITSWDLANNYVRAGQGHFDRGEYEKALEAFQKAYEYYQGPPVVLFLAQAHHKLKHFQEARELYQRYLNMVDASDRYRAEAEAELQAVELEIAKQEQEKAKAPKPPPAAKPRAVGPPPHPPGLSYGDFVWPAFSVSAAAGMVSLFSAWKAKQKHDAWENYKNDLLANGEVVGEPGNYHFATPKDQMEHAGRLRQLDQEVDRWQTSTIVGGVISLTTLAAGGALLWLDNRETERLQMTVEPQAGDVNGFQLRITFK